MASKISTPDLHRWFKNHIVKADPRDERNFLDWRTPVNWADIIPTDYLPEFIQELSQSVNKELYEKATPENALNPAYVTEQYSKMFLFSSAEQRARALHTVMVGDSNE